MSAEPRSRESLYLSRFQEDGNEKYANCYANMRISSGAHLIGVCVLQLCSVLDRHSHMSGSSDADVVLIGMKQQTAACKTNAYV